MAEEENRQSFPPAFEIPRQAVDRLYQELAENPIADWLHDWFPSREEQREYESADIDTKLGFLTDALGRLVTFEDFFVANRPLSEGGMEARAEDVEAIESRRQIIDLGLNNYVSYIADSLLQGNVELVARNLSLAGQAEGFCRMINHRFRQQNRLDTKASVTIQFSDGSSMEDADALLHLDSLPRMTEIESPRYERETNTLSFRLSS